MHEYMGMKSYICFEKSGGGSTQNAWAYIRGNHDVYKIIIFTIVVSNTWISGYDLRIRIYFDYKCVHRV